MIEMLSSATGDLVKLALDAASLRHQAIAANIANANSADYMPLRVNFEEQLQGARLWTNASLAQRARPFLETDTAALGSGDSRIMLDLEISKLAQNTIHYQALLKGLEKHVSIVASAIGGGRG